MRGTPEGRAAEVVVAVGAGAPGAEAVEAEAEEVVVGAEAEEVVAEAG